MVIYRHDLRLKPETEKQFQEIKKYANDSTDNLHDRLNNNSIIELALDTFMKLFVEPYERNGANNFNKLMGNYKKISNQESDEQTRLLKDILDDLEFLKLLGLNKSDIYPNSQIKSYLDIGSIQNNKEQLIKNIMKSNTEKIYKDKNM